MTGMQQPQCWNDVKDVFDAGIKRVILFGPSGTGKTFGALNYGKARLARRLTCTDDLTSGDIMGTWMPHGSEWRFKEGPAIQAWRGADGEGGRLVVDEVDRASGDGLAQLLNVTDSDLSARWVNPDTLESVEPGPNFTVVMTTNLEDLDALPAALRDRFPVAIRIDHPPIEAVQHLSSDLHALAFAGNDIRAGQRPSLRAIFAFDDLRTHLGAPRAAKLVFGAERAQAIMDAYAINDVASSEPARLGIEL